MVWWLWMVLGIALLALEAATPGGLFALFFGLSAVLVGGLTVAGWAGSVSTQWLLFSAISVAFLLLLRQPLRARLNLSGNQKPVDSFVGESAVVLEELPAGGLGKVELRGSSWSGRNASQAPLAKGQRCRVERIEGLTVWVKPE